LLLLFPFGLAPVLGVPVPNNYFYSTLLGAVLFGIGMALLIEAYGRQRGMHGLGIAGAIVINICGATILMLWLLSNSLSIPLRGYIVLWIIAIAVLTVGLIELISGTWEN
jgi:hypothetical protein